LLLEAYFKVGKWDSDPDPQVFQITGSGAGSASDVSGSATLTGVYIFLGKPYPPPFQKLIFFPPITE